MKKLIFLIFVGSIIIAQPHALKPPSSPPQIPSSQELHQMVSNQVLNKSKSQLDAQTGRPTREEWQEWNGSTWVNNMAIQYTYAPAKPQAGKFPDLVAIFYWLWISGAWEQNGHENWPYDTDGNLIEVLSYNLYGDPYYRRTYSGPFINGHPTSYVEEYYENGVWVNRYRYWYTFDNNGCFLDCISEYWTSGAWEYWSRQQYYYTQGCCPERWVFSYWSNNAWVINYMAAFTYAYVNCMTDMVPFAALLYLCNPTLVLMGPTPDGINMSSVDWRDEYTYTSCLAMTYLMYYMGVLQSFTQYGWNTWPSKVLSTYDNSNQRMTSQVTQTGNLVNSNRTWYSYEGLQLSAENDAGIPTNFELSQNYPNPFNPTTTISFDLSEGSDVKISIYDMTGRLIKELVNETMTVGSKTINWDGKDESGNPVSAGIYLYNLQTGDYNQTKKMVLLK